MRLIGDVRSELFHYEVRVTYDTPEIAESRRIVREAQQDNPTPNGKKASGNRTRTKARSREVVEEVGEQSSVLHSSSPSSPFSASPR